MENFNNFKIEKLNLTKIFGGDFVDTKTGKGELASCDCLDDTNGNGQPDPGECMTIIECE